MNCRILSQIIISFLSVTRCVAFTSVTPSSSTSRRSDSSLPLLPYSFSVVSTAIADTTSFSRTRHNTERVTLRDAYADVQRPVYTYTDSSNALTPAIEGVRQVVTGAKATVSNLAQTASKLGVSFGLSYSMLSNINGGVTLAVSWYMTCQRTGVSPVYQWKALLKSYAALYAFLQALKPVRIVAAISVASHTQKILDATQERFQCGKSKAVALQYACGYIAQAVVASVGVGIASAASGVPLFASP